VLSQCSLWRRKKLRIPKLFLTALRSTPASARAFPPSFLRPDPHLSRQHRLSFTGAFLLMLLWAASESYFLAQYPSFHDVTCLLHPMPLAFGCDQHELRHELRLDLHTARLEPGRLRDTLWLITALPLLGQLNRVITRHEDWLRNVPTRGSYPELRG
jgi:hypothetical protein